MKHPHMREYRSRFLKASGLALISLAIWSGVTIYRLMSGMVLVDNWTHWAGLLVVSFTSAALFGSAVTLALDAHGQKPRRVVLSEDYATLNDNLDEDGEVKEDG